MAYLDLLEDETVQSQYLVVLRPRRRVEGFTVFSGSVYVASFDFGEVVRAWDGLTELTQGSSSTLSSGQFWHDVTNSMLYVRLSGGGDPDSVWLTVAYEIYAATIDAHHNRIPTDSASRVVYFEPIVSKSNQIKQSTENALFGFSPVQSSNLNLINAEHLFERHLHDSSWNKAECLVYHWLDDLEVSNIKLVLNGLVLSYKLNPPSVELRVVDRIDALSQEWVHPSPQEAFFDSVVFPSIDRNAIGKPVRLVYGFITDGFVPVNISSVEENPTTSDNRTWVVCTGQSNLADVSSTVPASPASTTTRTYLTSVSGFNVDDSVWIDKATDEYVLVTAVGVNYIDHETLSVAATTGDTVKRAFVGKVTISQDNVEYIAKYGRDYTVTMSLAGTTSGFIFTTSMEANTGLPMTLRTIDRVYCRVYGPSNFVTLGGPAFGSNDTRTKNMAHPAQIVLDALKRHLGVTESEIDTASFTQALTDQSSGIGIAIPDGSFGTTFPKYKDVISQVLKSALAKLIIDADGKWSLLTVKPLGAVTKSIADDEILQKSIDWEYKYDDLVSQVTIEYAKREIGPSLSGTDLFSRVSTVSDISTFLHKSTATKTERSAWAYEAEAQELSGRLMFILGDRRGSVTLRTKNRFYTTKLGDNIEVQRTYLPGYSVDGITVFSREHAVSEVDKGRTQVTITLDDRKGVEDNSGGW